MGNKNSKEDKELLYWLKINEAISDSPPYTKYKKIKREIFLQLKKPKNSSHLIHFIINSIKKIIKNPKIPGKKKFFTLLLLKDLMEANNLKLIIYNAKKFLNRLYKLANSNLKENVLQVYDDDVDLHFSRNFYFLLLECFQKWKRFRKFSLKYSLFSFKLLKKKKISYGEKFYYYLERNLFNQFTEKIDFIKLIRINFIIEILEYPTFFFKGNEKLETMMEFYEENIDSLVINNLNNELNDGNKFIFTGLENRITKEFLYFKDFKREFKKAHGFDNMIRFYNILKELEFNYFEKNLNTNEAKNELIFENSKYKSLNFFDKNNPNNNNITMEDFMTENINNKHLRNNDNSEFKILKESNYPEFDDGIRIVTFEINKHVEDYPEE